jgi:hypothetical protein
VSVRLKVVSARPALDGIAPAATAVPRTRAAVPRHLLCVVSAGVGAQASLRFACALVAEVVRHGRAVTVLVTRGDAFATEGAARELRAAGAHGVAQLASADLPEAALGALDALEPHALAVALGAELATHLGALLTIRVGRDASVSGLAPLHPVDLELFADAEAVASEIGAWVARR